MQPKVKILHLVHSLASGGAERQLMLLSQQINKLAFENNVFYVNGADMEGCFSDSYLHQSPASSSISIKYLRGIFDAMRRVDPHVVHVWLPAAVAIPAILIGAFFRHKILFSYRNKMVFNHWLCIPQFILVYLFADKIISNHEPTDSASLYKWLFRKKRGEVIMNAVVVPPNTLRSGPAQKPIRLLCVGRLEPQKNFILLVRALKDVSCADWILSIYGDGSEKVLLEREIEAQGLCEKIRIEGRTHDIYQRMVNADYLIIPSIYEGMPNVLLEAMALRLPVVASDIPANRRIVGEIKDFYWIDPFCHKKMAKSLELILTTEENQDLVDKCKQLTKDFSVGAMTTSYEKIYLRLVASEGPLMKTDSPVH